MATLFIDRDQRITCEEHSPRPAARRHLGVRPFVPSRYPAADIAALAHALGGTIGCETCRAMARRNQGAR